MARIAPSKIPVENAQVHQTDGRRRLLAGAERVFRESGYVNASVDDIARAAGVSRQTFYRHFDGKLAIAIEYFAARRQETMPLWDGLTEPTAMDAETTKMWMLQFLAHLREHRRDLRALYEIGVFEPAFLNHAGGLVPPIIETLARNMTAFAATAEQTPAGRLLRAEAFLLIYQIIDQCTSAAMGFCIIEEPLLIEALSQSLVGFVRRNALAKPMRSARR